MYYIYLKLFAIMSLLVSITSAGDYVCLRDDADIYNRRINSPHLKDISPEEITTTLSYLTDKESLAETYKPKKFLEFYNKDVLPQTMSRFSNFAKNCKTLYEQSKDNSEKAAIFALLSMVTEEFQREKANQERLKKLEKLKKLKQIK